MGTLFIWNPIYLIWSYFDESGDSKKNLTLSTTWSKVTELGPL